MTLDQAKERGQVEADLHGIPIQIIRNQYSEDEHHFEYAPAHAVKYLFRDAIIVETINPTE